MDARSRCGAIPTSPWMAKRLDGLRCLAIGTWRRGQTPALVDTHGLAEQLGNEPVRSGNIPEIRL
jgi:hypothetical protein